MSNPKAILFDLDDTLISFDGVSEQAWEKCCCEFIHAHSLSITMAVLLKELNKKRKWYWSDPERHKSGRENIKNARREIVKLTLNTFGIFDDELIYELADNYSEYQNSLILLFPNTLNVLTELRRNGYRLGLITNGSSTGQREKINRFALNPYFEIILIDQEVGFSKPDIRIYKHALELLKLDPHDVWMVGDNLIWDIQSPKSLGIYTVWYDHKKFGLPINTNIIPDIKIQDISELFPEL